MMSRGRSFRSLAAFGIIALSAIGASAAPSLSPLPPPTLKLPAKSDYSGDTHRLTARFISRPLSFEENRGQIDRRVKFLSRGRGYELFLTPTEAVLTLSRSAEPRAVNSHKSVSPTGKTARAEGKATDGAALATRVKPAPRKKTATAVLRMRLLGANPRATISGGDELPGKANYFIGRGPDQWHTSIPTYAEVKYHNVYSGVDLIYHGGNQGQLEYDFVLAPGASPSAIALSVQGARRLKLDEHGELVLQLKGGGELRQHAPVAYQGEGKQRRYIAAGYILKNKKTAGFRLAAYDRSKAVVIDPTLIYSTYLGGRNQDYGFGIAIDSSGNAFVTGLTQSPDFPTTAGAFQTASKSTPGYIVFVTKLNPTGTALVYSTYLGGSGTDDGFGIAVDSSGNAFVTGDTASTDFPTTAGAFQTAFQDCSNNCNCSDAFVTKLNPPGTALVYSTYLGGGSCVDQGRGIAVDSSGNAFVTGFTGSTDFPTTAGALQTALQGSHNAFVTKLNPPGTALVYSSYLGGSNLDEGFGIALDSSGDVFVTGLAGSTDFPTTRGAFRTALRGDGNAFVTKLNPTGTALVYSTFLGGSGDGDLGAGIAVDSHGNAFVTGFTQTADFPTTAGAFQSSARPGQHAFVTKLNPTGTALVYSTFLGGNDGDLGSGIAVDSSGNAFVTGQAFSTDFPTTTGAFQTASRGLNGNAFVTELNHTGTALVYSSYLGGGGDVGNGIAVNSSGNAFVTGFTGSTDFPTTAGAFQTVFRGVFNGSPTTNAFVAEIRQAASPMLKAQPSILTFPPQIVLPPLGETSKPQFVTLGNLKNRGQGTTITVTGIEATAPFTAAKDCIGPIAPGGQCKVSVTVTPTAVGKITPDGTLTITSDTSNSTITVTLRGSGKAGAITIQPNSLSFPKTTAGTTSAAKTVTLTNKNGIDMSLGTPTTSAPFAIDSATTNCTSTLTANGGTCNVGVVFKPTTAGKGQKGTLTINDNAAKTPQSVQLTGTGG